MVLNNMVSYQVYMSVAMTQCGSDEQTFSKLAESWNREKETIKQMTKQEVRDNLSCP